MTDYPADPLRDALAWFITEDETNSGGTDEESNKYWLAGLRMSKQYFASEQEIHDRADLHRNRIASRPEGWDEDSGDLPETHTAHETLEAQIRTLEWAKIV